MRRLDQLLANLGYCSRSQARDFLRTHDVTLLGATTRPGAGVVQVVPLPRLRDAAMKVDPAAVRVDGAPLDHPDGLLLLLHKPLGLVCSHDGREGPAVYDLLPPRWRARHPAITSIGRLDKDTSGLLLLTDQTELVHRLTSPKHKVAKTYVATLDRDVPPAARDAMIALFAAGTLVLTDEETPCAPAALAWSDARTATLVLTEGRYHQVRRMFASQGAEVLALHRSHFGPLDLGDLPAGQWRELPLETFSAPGTGAALAAPTVSAASPPPGTTAAPSVALAQPASGAPPAA